MRNYWIPIISYNAWKFVIYGPELAEYQAAPDILKFFLLLLCALHLYWLVIFLQMLVQAILTKNTDDSRSVSIKE